MKILPIVICAIVIIFIQCAKELSCEGCLGWPIVPMPTDTLRTTPNELLTRCSIYINDEKLVKNIYVETTTKYHPNTYWIFDSIVMDGRKLYDTTFDLKNYFDMSRFIIGDSFIYRTHVRWRFEPSTFENLDTLIY